MSHQSSYVLPDILPGYARDGSAFIYAHAARIQDARRMISFTTNALSIVLDVRTAQGRWQRRRQRP